MLLTSLIGLDGGPTAALAHETRWLRAGLSASGGRDGGGRLLGCCWQRGFCSGCRAEPDAQQQLRLFCLSPAERRDSCIMLITDDGSHDQRCQQNCPTQPRHLQLGLSR